MLLAHAELHLDRTCQNAKADQESHLRLGCVSAYVANCCKQPSVAGMGCVFACCAGQTQNDGCRTIWNRCSLTEAYRDEKSEETRTVVLGCETDGTVVAVAIRHEVHACFLASAH